MLVTARPLVYMLQQVVLSMGPLDGSKYSRLNCMCATKFIFSCFGCFYVFTSFLYLCLLVVVTQRTVMPARLGL